jgi:hypothetical protein
MILKRACLRALAALKAYSVLPVYPIAAVTVLQRWLLMGVPLPQHDAGPSMLLKGHSPFNSDLFASVGNIAKVSAQHTVLTFNTTLML